MGYRHNVPKVIQETLNDETLVIDSETGTCFSLKGTASLVWQSLEHGAAADGIAAGLAAAIGTDEAALIVDVERFIAELAAEGLVVPADPATPAIPAATASLGGWSAPRIEKFTEMERLLTIDPIHMVEDSGWPHEKKG